MSKEFALTWTLSEETESMNNGKKKDTTVNTGRAKTPKAVWLLHFLLAVLLGVAIGAFRADTFLLAIVFMVLTVAVVGVVIFLHVQSE